MLDKINILNYSKRELISNLLKLLNNDQREKILTLLIKLNSDQMDMFCILVREYKYQFRVPTGVGKGYVMILHIIFSLMYSDYKIFAIASHRLSLNNQHLRDIIELVIDMGLISKVKFLTIGSANLNINKVLDDPKNVQLKRKYNKSLAEYNIPLDIKSRLDTRSIFKSTLSKAQVNQIITENTNNGFKTIIVTTYNSLDKLRDNELDITYLDEAHILASNKEESEFRKSYEMIKSKKRFFFTATPKDVEEQLIKDGEYSDIFLMNNQDIFGDIYTIPFVKCVLSGYITKPIVHIACPNQYSDTIDYDSIDNRLKFVADTFSAHEKWLKSVSAKPEEIEAKLLIRCKSVPDMWDMYYKLIDILPSDILLCAGASYGPVRSTEGAGKEHVFGKEWISDRDDFIKKIQEVDDKKKMIILNFDIFSEGINVYGITGVMFLQGKMPSIAKVIQNIGRSTRLHRIDRDLLRNGQISTDDYSKWVKPYCAVIIPYWDTCSEFTKNIIAKRVKDLRDSWDFDPHFVLSVGDDISDGDGDDDIEGLNKLNKGNKRIKLIEEINQEIEKMKNEDMNLVEIEKINQHDEDEHYQYLLTLL